MESVRIQTGDTERIEALILDGSLDPLTGKTDILISIRRISDGFWFDFNDLTFKSTAWTTRQLAMTETDTTNDPGVYHYNFNTSTITNVTTDDVYEIRVDQSPGTDAANVPLSGEIKVGHFVDDIDQSLSATESNIRGGSDDLDSLSDQLDGVQTEVNGLDGEAMRGSDGVPTNPLLTNDARLNNLDATISSRSSHVAADIWAVGTRTLTSFGTLVADIWNNLTRTLTAGTKDAEIDAIKLETDKIQPDIIDVPNNYKADVSGLAAEANATINKNEIIAEVDINEAKIDAMGLIVSDIQTQTDKIPAMIIDLTFLKDIEGGNWERDGVQMIFKTALDVEVARFNLFKFDGTPAQESDEEVAKRERV